MNTEDKKVLDLLQKEINVLKQLLSEIDQAWEEKTLEQFSNDNGLLTESVCLPIRAAINLIKDKS